MRYRTWMQDSKEIYDTPLANICLPATHDSGTYALQDWLTHDKVGDLADVYNLLRDFKHELEAIPGLEHVIKDPMDWIHDQVYPALKDLARATSRSIRQQLEDGIRVLDLRIFYDHEKELFYTWHGLVGTPLDTILYDLQSFLEQTSAGGGEIVYVTVSHYMDSKGKKEVPYKQLAKLLTQSLGKYIYLRKLDSTDATKKVINDPFQQTYNEIVTYTGGSAVIVVYDEGARLEEYENDFWPKSYSPPEGGGTIYGSYDETESLSDMLSDQQQKLRTAMANGSPFALYMTLTPSAEMWTNTIALAFAAGLHRKAAQIYSEYPKTAALLEETAIGISELFPPPEWRSIAALAKQVDRHLTDLVHDQFVSIGGRSPNRISMIYLDYYETTHVVDLAIRLSGARTLDWVGDHAIVFKNEPDASNSDTTVALAVLDRSLIAAYVSNGVLYWATAWYFNDYSVWLGGTPITVVETLLGSNAQPALASFQKNLWLAYLVQDSSDDSTIMVNLAKYNGSAWSGGTAITLNGSDLQAWSAPALIEYRGLLYLIYRNAGIAGTINVATSSDGVTWSGGQPITISDSSKIPLTNGNITATVHDEQLYIFFLGLTNESTIYYASFDGSQWSGNEPIFSGSPKQTSAAPAAASIDGTLWLTFKESGSTDLTAAVLVAGTWSTASVSPLSPNSPVNPALVQHEGGLCMVYPGTNGGIYSAAYLPNASLWSGGDAVVTSPSAITLAPAAATMLNQAPSPAIDELWMAYSTSLLLSYTATPGGTWNDGGDLELYVDASTPPAMATYDDWYYAAFGITGSDRTCTIICEACNGPDTRFSNLALKLPYATGPALAQYNELLYLAIVENDGNIYTATFDQQTSQWSTPESVASQPGGINAQSTIRPALATHGSLLYLCWLNGSNQLCIATFDGHQWTGGSAIGFLNSAINPRSTDAPAMISYGGRLWLFYKSASANTLYVTWHADESWVGDVQLQTIMHGITPESPYGPTAALFQDTLCLLYVDASNQATIDMAVYERTLAATRSQQLSSRASSEK